MKKKYLFLTLFILFLISCESTSSNELQNSTFEELETARNIDVTTTSNQNLTTSTTSTTTTTTTTSTTTTTIPVSKSINNIIKSFSLEEAEPWCSGPVSFIDFQNGYYFFVKHDWNSSFNCDYSDFDNDSQNSVVVLIEGESNITELSPNIVMECSLDEKGNFITSSVSLDYFPESSNLPGKSIYSSFNSYVFDNVSYGNGVVLSSFDNYLPRYHSVEYELNASGGSDGEFWYEPDKMTFPINGNFKYYFFHSENLKIKIPLDPRLIGIYEKSEAIFDFNLGNIYDSFKSIREVNGLNQNYQSLFSNKNFISSCFDQYSYTAPVKDYENKNIDNSLKADAKKYFQLTRRLLLGTQLLERLEKQITYMLYQLFDAETYSRNPELDLFVYFDDEVELSIRDSKTFLSGNNQYNWKSNEFFKFIKTDQVQRADIIIYGNYENYLKNLQENYENNIEECILNQTCSSVFTTNNYDNSNDNYSPSDYSSFYRAHMYLFSMDSFEGFIKYYLVGDQHPNISLDELKSIYSRIPFKLDSYDRAGWASLDIETFISWFIGFD